MSLRKRRSQSVINERLSAIESLIVEDVNKDTINAAVSVIKKLNAIDLSPIPILDRARDEAVAAAADALGSGDSKGFVDRVAGLFRDKRSPLLDSLAFAAALRSLFPTLEKFATAITAKAGRDVDQSLSLNQLVSDDKVYAGLRNVVKMGFRPDGRLAQVGNTWRKRFVSSSDDEIADEILDVPLETLRDVARMVSTAVSGVSKLSTSLPTASEPKPESANNSKVDKAIKVAIEKTQSSGLKVPSGAVELLVRALADQGLLK